jgi:hypothetical protein
MRQFNICQILRFRNINFLHYRNGYTTYDLN